MSNVFKQRISLTGQRKLEACGFDSIVNTLLMWLRVSPTNGKKATDVRSSLDVPSLWGGITA